MEQNSESDAAKGRVEGQLEPFASRNLPVPLACDTEELLTLSEPQARGFLTREAALERRVLPLQVIVSGNKRILRVAMEGQPTHDLEQWLTFATGFAVQLVPVADGILEEAASRAYLGDESRFAACAGELKRYGETLAPEASPCDEAESDSKVVRFIECLLDYAVAHEASDIHLAARSGGSFVQLRIAGELRHHAEALSNLATHRQLVSRLKVMAQLDITGRVLPQEGRFQHRFGARRIDVRISIVPTIRGENVVLRIFGRDEVRPLDTLGIHADLLEEIRHCLQRCAGGLIIAGPTGSGKTSTLYAMVDQVRRGHAVSTIEDPVEISIEGVAQTSVNEALEFGFPEAVRAVLRQDPDVILIGEMRDRRTAEAVFDAALSGHLVLSTVHGGTIIEALLRLEHLGVSRKLLAQGINLLIAQRLEKKLCPECRVFDLRAANAIGCDVFKPVGCVRCNYAGYAGLALIVEALVVTEPVRDYLRRAETLSSSALSEVAAGSFWRFREQILLSLERGDISYAQYEELVMD